MGGAPSVGSLGAERLANHGMELRTPLITAPSGRYQGAPALIPAVRCQKKTIPVHRTIQAHCLWCALKRGPPLSTSLRLGHGATSRISLYCSTSVVHWRCSFLQTAGAAVSYQEWLYAQAHTS
jgi:hypothetical protein